MSLSLPRDLEKCWLHWVGPHQIAAWFFFFFPLFVYFLPFIIYFYFFLQTTAKLSTRLLLHLQWQGFCYTLGLRVRKVNSGYYPLYNLQQLLYIFMQIMRKSTSNKVWKITQQHYLTYWSSLHFIYKRTSGCFIYCVLYLTPSSQTLSGGQTFNDGLLFY